MRDVSDCSDKKLANAFKINTDLIENHYEAAKKNVFSTNVEHEDQTLATLIFADNCSVNGQFSASEKVIIRQTMQDLNTYLRTLLKICHEYQRLEPNIDGEFQHNPLRLLPDLQSINEIQTLHDIITDPDGIVKIINERTHECLKSGLTIDYWAKKFTGKLNALQRTELGYGDQREDYQASPDFTLPAYQEVNAFGEVIFYPEITTLPAPIYLGTGERPSSEFLSEPFLSDSELANFGLDLNDMHVTEKAFEAQSIEINRSDDYSHRRGLVEARECIEMPSGGSLFATACTHSKLYVNHAGFIRSLRIRSNIFALGITRSQRMVMMFDRLYHCYYLGRYLYGSITPVMLFKGLIDDRPFSASSA